MIYPLLALQRYSKEKDKKNDLFTSCQIGQVSCQLKKKNAIKPKKNKLKIAVSCLLERKTFISQIYFFS